MPKTKFEMKNKDAQRGKPAPKTCFSRKKQNLSAPLKAALAAVETMGKARH